MAVCAALLYLALARAVRLHQGRASTASLEEMVLLGAGMAASGAVVFLANLYFQWIPRTVPAGAAMGALVFAAWGRATWRRLKEREEQGGDHESSSRVLVVGTGEAGRELLGSMLRDPRGTWTPVGLLDDDPHTRHRRLRAVPVVGTTTQPADQVQATRAEAVVIASRSRAPRRRPSTGSGSPPSRPRSPSRCSRPPTSC